jgi:hypothetical protein
MTWRLLQAREKDQRARVSLADFSVPPTNNSENDWWALQDLNL